MANEKVSNMSSATLTEADEFYVNDGLTSRKATIAELRQALFPTGFIMLDLSTARGLVSDDIPNQATLAGGILGADTLPVLERSDNATDKSLRIHWVVDGVEEITFGNIPMPPDLDETADITVHLVAELDGSTDDGTVIDVQVFNGVGDTEMGGDTTGINDTIGEVTVTIANADISGHPTGFLNISLVPGGHSTDGIFLYVGWLEYKTKLAV